MIYRSFRSFGLARLDFRRFPRHHFDLVPLPRLKYRQVPLLPRRTRLLRPNSAVIKATITIFRITNPWNVGQEGNFCNFQFYGALKKPSDVFHEFYFAEIGINLILEERILNDRSS